MPDLKEGENWPYWVVLLEPGKGLTLHECTDPQGAANLLKGLPVGAEGVVIYGRRLQVTQGPHRYLKALGGSNIPLFDSPIMGALESTFALGPVPDDPTKEAYEGLLRDAKTLKELSRPVSSEDQFLLTDDEDGD